MDVITTIGLDIAKNVFQLHCVDGQGKSYCAGRCSGPK
jgi:transposase